MAYTPWTGDRRAEQCVQCGRSPNDVLREAPVKGPSIGGQPARNTAGRDVYTAGDPKPQQALSSTGKRKHRRGAGSR